MPGPLPIYRPDFPPDFLAQAQALVRRRSVKYQLRQRATLAPLLCTGWVWYNSLTWYNMEAPRCSIPLVRAPHRNRSHATC
jgi:hypothetical protein